jgi:site-specific DNA-methyltransferase (adenine-specific)
MWRGEFQEGRMRTKRPTGRKKPGKGPASLEDRVSQKVLKVGSARISLNLGDCFKGLETLEPGSVDLVVTSPPYNIGVRYNNYDDSIKRSRYLDWMEQWAVLVKRVLAEDGSLFLNIGGTPKDPWGPMEVAMRLRDHLKLQNVIHWIKSIAIDKSSNGDDHGLVEDINVGHIKPINSDRFLSDAHESVFHFTKTGKVKIDRLAIGAKYKDKSNIARWKSSGKDCRCRGNAWFIPYKTIMSRKLERPHPASFPPKLAEMCVKLHGLDKTGLVMDPFMGIGNTAVACVDLGVDCVGFEIDSEYFDCSCERVADMATIFTGLE